MKTANLLQQRAVEVLNILERVQASSPSCCPRASASEIPAILTANAKLLHIFAAWIFLYQESFPFPIENIKDKKYQLWNRKTHKKIESQNDKTWLFRQVSIITFSLQEKELLTVRDQNAFSIEKFSR